MRWTVLSVGSCLVLAVPSCGEPPSSVATHVAVGLSHACAAFKDGSTRCWGNWEKGQRGLGVSLNDWPKEWARSYELRVNPKRMVRPNRVVQLEDAVELAAGESHTCARRKDGTVWCWGPAQLSGSTDLQDRYGDLAYPVKAEGITDAVQLTAGSSFTCARRASGSVWCWGAMRDGRTFVESTEPRPVGEIEGAVEVRAGGDLGCALLENGTVRCWGRSTKGQLGDGSVGNTSIIDEPKLLAQRDVGTLVLGHTRTCALSAAGAVSCWAKDGQRSVPEGLTLRTLAVESENACGQTEAGALVCWGSTSSLRQLLPASRVPDDAQKIVLGTFPNAKQLVLGNSHACLRLESGGVQCWGSSWRDTTSERNESAIGPFAVQGLGKTVSLAAGPFRTCAVSEDGRVRCWTRERKLDAVEGVSEATQVCLGGTHACALRSNGTVTCWGNGDRGQLGREPSERGNALPPAIVPGLGNVEQVVASDQATCARLRSGGVSCWGNNSKGELGQGFFSSAGPKSAIGNPRPVRLPRPAVDLHASQHAFCATLSDGSIACWGNNVFHTPVPSKESAKRASTTLVRSVTDGVQIAVAAEHACVRTKGGKVLCWGSNEHGQMGDGTLGQGNLRSTPVEVAVLSGATDLLVSAKATCGRMAGGRLSCVGGNAATVWDVPGVQPASQIALHPEHHRGEPERPSGCAVMNNGALACWGISVPDPKNERSGTGPVQVRW
jgi:alpha-tubulin suppressor-like RCC1 family protein